MRTKLIESNKPEKIIHSVRNADTSAGAQTIPAGSPLVLNLSSTPQPTTYQQGLQPGWEDGLQVVLPSTAGAANEGLFFYGIATGPIVAQALGECMVHGVAMAAMVRGTRASSNVSWASSASVSNALNFGSVDTVNNAIGTATSNANAGGVYMIVLDNFGTAAGSASSPTDTRTAATILGRVFVRGM